MFKVADLRGKIAFTILILAVFRLGCHVPLPYVDFGAIQQVQDQAKLGGAGALLDLFSGGGLTSGGVFAQGVMPYITASVIMQVLGGLASQLGGGREGGAGGHEEN